MPRKLLPASAVPDRLTEEEFGTMERPREDRDLEAKMQRTAEIISREYGGSLVESAEENTGTRLCGETNEGTDEETGEETGEEKLSQFHGDERFPAATNHIQKSFYDQNFANSDDSPAVPVSRTKGRCSNFTEPSFSRGSFLPPFKKSFIQANRQERQSIRESNSDFAVCFNDEEFWLDTAIKNSLRKSSSVAQRSPWHGG